VLFVLWKLLPAMQRLLSITPRADADDQDALDDGDGAGLEPDFPDHFVDPQHAPRRL